MEVLVPLLQPGSSGLTVGWATASSCRRMSCISCSIEMAAEEALSCSTRVSARLLSCVGEVELGEPDGDDRGSNERTTTAVYFQIRRRCGRAGASTLTAPERRGRATGRPRPPG